MRCSKCIYQKKNQLLFSLNLVRLPKSGLLLHRTMFPDFVLCMFVLIVPPAVGSSLFAFVPAYFLPAIPKRFLILQHLIVFVAFIMSPAFTSIRTVVLYIPLSV